MASLTGFQVFGGTIWMVGHSMTRAPSASNCDRNWADCAAERVIRIVLPVSSILGDFGENLSSPLGQQLRAKLEAKFLRAVYRSCQFLAEDASAVETRDQALDAEPGSDKSRSSRDGNLTASTQGTQQAPFCSDRGVGRRMIQHLEESPGLVVSFAADDSKSTLADGRDHNIVVQNLRNARFMSKALQSGNRENDSIKFTGSELSQPGVYVSAQGRQVQQREAMAQLNLPAKAAGSDRGAFIQFL